MSRLAQRDLLPTVDYHDGVRLLTMRMPSGAALDKVRLRFPVRAHFDATVAQCEAQGCHIMWGSNYDGRTTSYVRAEQHGPILLALDAPQTEAEKLEALIKQAPPEKRAAVAAALGVEP